MNERLQRILSLLCVLALALGCITAGALAENPQTEVRVITLEWMDNDNFDDSRPDSVYVTLGDQTIELLPPSWTGTVTVPADTGNDWYVDLPDGYSQGGTGTKDNVTVYTLSHPTAPTISVTASVTWDDSDNWAGQRPESVTLMLLADDEPCGEPIAVKESTGWKATWSGLRKYHQGSTSVFRYSVRQMQTPEGYVTKTDGLEVTNSLETGNLQLKASVTGAPEGTDLSALTLIVDGPDPTMPRSLTYGQLANGSYDFGTVLPGAYLVRNNNADQLAEGYIMDAANSKVSDAVYIKPGETATLEFKFTYKLPEPFEVEDGYDPMANIGNLTFEILGPDARMPMTLTYAQFTDGKYELPDLQPGVYTVVERNAETLVKYYTLTSSSITGMAIAVRPGAEPTVKLENKYTVIPTPEPDAEFVDIPVTKTWNDNDNKDGNRPESITVRLYADGIEVDSHVVTAADGWAYTFVDKPRYREDNRTEIVYTVGEDAVAMYAAVINGYNIVNNYQPETTSVSVSKVWWDNDNEQKLRPTSIAMTLSDGQREVTVVVLNEANGWTYTVNNLPTVVNGQPAKYAWKEQSVLNYTLEGVEQRGSTMIFTNRIWERPETPTQGRRPKTPGRTWYVFEDYDTPLGVEVVINHVGDCFD